MKNARQDPHNFDQPTVYNYYDNCLNIVAISTNMFSTIALFSFLTLDRQHKIVTVPLYFV